MRNKLKGLRLVLVSLLILLTSGLVFLNAIKDNRPKDGQPIEYNQLRDYLIKAQGTIYIAVLSCIMSNVNTVALSCNTFIYLSSFRQRNLLQVIFVQKVQVYFILDLQNPYLSWVVHDWRHHYGSRGVLAYRIHDHF